MHCFEHHHNREEIVSENQFRTWLLEELRLRKWNQAELARRTGILPSVISRWMNKDWLPDATSCFKLSQAFNVDFNMVLRLAGHNPVEPPVATGQHERLMGMVKALDLSDPTRVSTLDGILRMWLEADEEKKARDHAEGGKGNAGVIEKPGAAAKRGVHHLL